MNKKSLFILLILPFIIAISFFAASNLLFTKIEGDVLNIEWAYKNFEAFSVKSGRIKLQAKAVLPNNQGEIDASLLWKVENVNVEEENHAYIETSESNFYLVPVSEGDIIISCRNVKGTIQKSFKARLYNDGAIIINTKRARSFDAIDPTDYYGEYDFVGSREEKASFYIDVDFYPEYLKDSVIIETSPNITYEPSTGLVSINESGPSFISYDVALQEDFKPSTYEFEVIEDGYNVYNYNDLLNCTNKSQEGKIVCLQTNLESLENTYKTSDNGSLILKDEITQLFGNLNKSTFKFNFENEVVHIKSNYNTEFIKQANEKRGANISDQLVVGVHIKKDFYGNGYKINAHNLCYPSGTIETENGIMAALTASDLFRGPLPFIVVGELNTPIVKSFGQDNIGFYVDGDNITLNDVYFKNCDFSDILQNNDTTGTVLEINGDNVTIKNSHLSSGRNVLRSYSNKNVVVKNSLLEKSREFIAKVGSNEYEKINFTSKINYFSDGQAYSKTRYDFLNKTSTNNSTLSSISSTLLNGYANSSTISMYQNYANIIQEALNEEKLIRDVYGNKIFKNEITFDDTYFYQSGLFSIGIDTMFNGPYLYNGTPIQGLGYFDSYLYPDNVSGINYPSNITLKGDTRFYDYKDYDTINLDTLVYQDISSQLNRDVSIDQFFPIKAMMLTQAKNRGIVRYKDGVTMINTPLVYFGGGRCLSEVNTDELLTKDKLTEAISIDYFSYILQQPSKGMFVDMLGRSVSMAIGFDPFKIMLYNQDAYLYGESVSLENLKARV